jgi:large subunit ribosomal protein L19
MVSDARPEIAMTNKILQNIEQQYQKKDIPQFRVGDSVDVHTRILEGEKERIQIFSGTVIMKKGAGMNETFTVRRIVNNEGVERIFPIHSPFIAKVAVRRSGETRRAKLFYLRQRVGKAVRLAEQRKVKKDDTAEESAPVIESTKVQAPALAAAG